MKVIRVLNRENNWLTLYDRTDPKPENNKSALHLAPHPFIISSPPGQSLKIATGQHNPYKMTEGYNYSYETLLAQGSVPPDTLALFSKLPCAQPYLEAKATNHYRPVPFVSQQITPNSNSNSFFNATIKSPQTITHALALMHQKLHHAPPDPTASNEKVAQVIQDLGSDPAFVLFVQVGDGLNGFADTVHGGVLASLLDEAIGCCVETYRSKFSDGRTELYTANLNVSYRAPAPSGGVLYVKTWLRKREGRKWFLEGEVLSGDGIVRTTAKCLYVSQRTAAL